MARSQIWDGVEWVSMTGGAGEEGGGGEPDDTYLRLDGANNPASPSNFLRKSDGDALYIPIGGNAGSADKWSTARTVTVTLTGDVTGSGATTIDGTANKTIQFTATVGNDTHTHDTRYYTGAQSDAKYAILAAAGSQSFVSELKVGPGISGAQVRNVWHSGSAPGALVGTAGDLFVEY